MYKNQSVKITIQQRVKQKSPLPGTYETHNSDTFSLFNSYIFRVNMKMLRCFFDQAPDFVKPVTILHFAFCMDLTEHIIFKW